MVKNLPAMWETWVPSLVWEDPLEKGMATHSSILAWRVSWTEVRVHWVTESDTTEQLHDDDDDVVLSFRVELELLKVKI